ncbi:MAG TPA: thiamine pyrophosphate-dependent enzyme [Methylomirabilota bacterium]|nr:thiamine pyrophosphate-dependent enzyme [Methylomirabilota bacterium]
MGKRAPFPACEPNSVLISNGLAALGFALPAAVAAQLLHPERRVVAVAGSTRLPDLTACALLHPGACGRSGSWSGVPRASGAEMTA